MTTFGAAVIIIHKLLENKTRGLGGGNNKADLVLAARTIDKWGRNIKETTESERGEYSQLTSPHGWLPHFGLLALSNFIYTSIQPFIFPTFQRRQIGVI